MLSTAIMAGLGFFFWLINARLFSPGEIGLATTLIASMNMIAVLSLIGFDSVYVRFLPAERDKNKHMNTGLILVGTTALLLSAGFVICARFIVPKLAFVSDGSLVSLLFIGATVMAALNILTDAIFVAERHTEYTLTINTIFSFIKMLLPFAFFPWGAVGIFAAAALSQMIGVILSIAVMMLRCGYRPELALDRGIIGRVWRYSSANYFAGILSLLPSSVLPLLIVNRLGAEDAAYFYIATMVAGLLYVIPSSLTRSLFAESSNSEENHHIHLVQTLRFAAALLFPAIAILLIGSPILLSIFGASYAAGASTLLRLLALNAVGLGIYMMFVSIFKFTKHLNALLIANAVYALSVIGLSYALLPYGLTGIGIGSICGSALTALCGYMLHRPKLH